MIYGVEKYYGISPYAYCANNPTCYIDPDGRKWKKIKDEEIAKRLQQQVIVRDNSLAKQEAKINAKIEKIENNAKLSAEKKTQQIAKQQAKLENVREQRTILSNFNEGITQLSNSKTTYTFNTVEQGITATLSSMADGTIVVNNYGTTGNRAHETTHAIQYNNGNISFKKLGGNIVNFYIDYRALEIQAYRTEYSIVQRKKYPEIIPVMFYITLNSDSTFAYSYQLEWHINKVSFGTWKMGERKNNIVLQSYIQDLNNIPIDVNESANNKYNSLLFIFDNPLFKTTQWTLRINDVDYLMKGDTLLLDKSIIFV
jgi:hypothetical protein